MVRVRLGKVELECTTEELLELLKCTPEELRELFGLPSQQEIPQSRQLGSQATEPLERSEIERLNHLPRIPTKEEVVAFIEAKGWPFKHTIKECMAHFFGITGKWRDISGDRRLYDRFYDRLREAHKILERKYGGKFVSEYVTERVNGTTKPFKVFYMVREGQEPRRG